MRDKSDRYQVQTVPMLVPTKRLGAYLVDAGLLTADQINVILNDQQSTGMRFGEIVTARGWVKEQTIEWIVQKVVEPERYKPVASSSGAVKPSAATAQALRPKSLHVLQTAAENVKEVEQQRSAAETILSVRKPLVRRESPISKPLPPVKSPDGDVNWVG
jgi:hypothetical protein